MSDWLSFRHNGDGDSNPISGWSPGARYSYRQWLRRERRAEAEARRRERGRIAQLDDYALAGYLATQADAVDVSWIARVSFRAGRHEAAIVRGWPDMPKL